VSISSSPCLETLKLEIESLPGLIANRRRPSSRRALWLPSPAPVPVPPVATLPAGEIVPSRSRSKIATSLPVAAFVSV
jgi:hypothetical protein